MVSADSLLATNSCPYRLSEHDFIVAGGIGSDLPFSDPKLLVIG